MMGIARQQPRSPPEGAAAVLDELVEPGGRLDAPLRHDCLHTPTDAMGVMFHCSGLAAIMTVRCSHGSDLQLGVGTISGMGYSTSVGISFRSVGDGVHSHEPVGSVHSQVSAVVWSSRRVSP